MKRIAFIILALFLIFINSANAKENYTQKDLKVVAKDGFNIQAHISYPKIKGQKSYKTVVLLHSLGYNSQWWCELPNLLLKNGYAVVTVDLRGHGKSVYNKRLIKVSWKSMTNKAYAKYPQDVVDVIENIKTANPKKDFFNEWAIVGCDIGASAGIIAADNLSYKPKTIVMISPVIKAKGLYPPVSIAQLGTTDFLVIYSKYDVDSVDSANYLKKFAQQEYMQVTSNSKTNGNLLIKNDEKVSILINEWIKQYFQ